MCTKSSTVLMRFQDQAADKPLLSPKFHHLHSQHNSAIKDRVFVVGKLVENNTHIYILLIYEDRFIP